MKSYSSGCARVITSRSPHGERGLKCGGRGAVCYGEPGRSPHGERGLKYKVLQEALPMSGRSPHGERGLKSSLGVPFQPYSSSLPTRGAWIEITGKASSRTRSGSRSPHGERGLKSKFSAIRKLGRASLPTRGAWIEIFPQSRCRSCSPVAPHTGSVD